MPGEMIEIRWHARGGQGAKTAATLLAAVAMQDGKYGQGFPYYGPERMGAPIQGFTRISQKPITVHSNIYTPDAVVVLDPTLLDAVDVCEGLSDNGIIIVNTPKSPAEVRAKLGLKGRKVFTVDGTQISIEEIGRPIPNTPMMGALAKALPVVKLETILDDMKHKFAKLGDAVVKGNVRAVQRAYEEVKSE
jgi:pyruvate ferredoxin oxidoreductase gamma subunit